MEATPRIDIQQVAQQIGPLNLAAVGARDFVRDTDCLMMRVGSKRGRVEKLIVTLDPSDTYSVRYVAMRTRDFEMLVDESESGVYAERLGEVVRRMGDRA